jgi:Rod binding domain-containing protein
MDNFALNTFQQAQIAAGSAAQNNLASKAQSITNFADVLKGSAIENNSNASDSTEIGTKTASKEDIDPRFLKAAEEFEAVFLSEMLTPVFDKLDVDPLFGGGNGEQMYRSMMVQEYGKQLAKNGGVGIQDVIVKQLQEYAKGVE